MSTDLVTSSSGRKIFLTSLSYNSGRLSNCHIPIDGLSADIMCHTLSKIHASALLNCSIMTQISNTSGPTFLLTFSSTSALQSITCTFCTSSSDSSQQHVFKFMQRPYAWPYKYLIIFSPVLVMALSLSYHSLVYYVPHFFSFHVSKTTVKFSCFTSSILRFE